MSSTVEEINFKVKATDEASTVFGKVAQNAAASAQQAAQGGGGGNGIIGDLKSSFGRSSALSQSLKIAAGGGAVIGLSMVGQEINGLATKIGEVRKMSEDGAGTGAIAEHLAKSLPIFGPLIEAGRKFRAEMDGSAEAVERLNLQTSMVNAETKSALAGMERAKAERQTGIDAMLKKVEESLAAAKMPADEAASFGIKTQLERQLAPADDLLTAFRKKVRDDNQASRDAIQEAATPAERRLQSAKDDLDDTKTTSFKIRFPLSGGNETTKRQNEYNAALSDIQTIAERRAKLKASEDKEIAEHETKTEDFKKKIAEDAGGHLKKLQDDMAMKLRDAERENYAARIVDAEVFKEKMVEIHAQMRQEMLRYYGLDLEADLEQSRQAADRAKQDAGKKMAEQMAENMLDPDEVARIGEQFQAMTDLIEKQFQERESRFSEKIAQRQGLAVFRRFIAPGVANALGIASGSVEAYMQSLKQGVSSLSSNSAIDGGVSTGIGRALNERAAASTAAQQTADSVKRLEQQAKDVLSKFELMQRTIESFTGKVGAK